MRHMGPAPGATPALVAAEIEGADADQVTRVVLHFRTANAPAWTRGDLGRAAPGRFEGALPVAPESGDIEYWLEALRNDDTVAATAGSAMLPMRFAATPAVEEEDEHWYQQWWLWAAVGAAVAGTVAATVYVVTRDDNGTNANPCDVAGQGCVEVTYQ